MKLVGVIFFLTVFSIVGQSQASYRSFSPCSFYIEIPASVTTSKMYSDQSSDYCDYEVRLRDGYMFMELHSMLKSRFATTSLNSLYNQALRSSDLDITYQTKGVDFFVISGYNANGNIVYWRRSVGDAYISDMRIEYNKGRKSAIDPLINRMSKSFFSY